MTYANTLYLMLILFPPYTDEQVYSAMLSVMEAQG